MARRQSKRRWGVKKCLACKGTGFINHIGWKGHDMSHGTEMKTSHCGECGGTGFEKEHRLKQLEGKVNK